MRAISLVGINFGNLLNSDFSKMMSPEFISSLLVMLLIIIFSFVVFIKVKTTPIDSEPKGIINICEIVVNFADNNVNSMMGAPKFFNNFGAYIIILAMYIFGGFFVGMMGIPNPFMFGLKSEGYLLNETTLYSSLPSPFTNLGFTLLLGLLTVVLIEVTKMRTKKWKYFNQFIFNFPPLLPLVTNFVPMISLGMRLFGNAFAGFCIMTLLYNVFNAIGNGIGLIGVPLIMPFMHAYFDLFSGFIQTLVFVMLTMMNVAQQAPEEKLLDEEQITFDRKTSLLKKNEILAN